MWSDNIQFSFHAADAMLYASQPQTPPQGEGKCLAIHFSALCCQLQLITVIHMAPFPTWAHVLHTKSLSIFLLVCSCFTQVEDNSQPFLAKATMDRECPYDPTALPFKVCWATHICHIELSSHCSVCLEVNNLCHIGVYSIACSPGCHGCEVMSDGQESLHQCHFTF